MRLANSSAREAWTGRSACRSEDDKATSPQDLLKMRMDIAPFFRNRFPFDVAWPARYSVSPSGTRRTGVVPKFGQVPRKFGQGAVPLRGCYELYGVETLPYFQI